MKTRKTMKNRRNGMISMVLFAMLATVNLACDDEKKVTVMPSAFNSEIVTVPFFVTNTDGNMPGNDNELLYEVRVNNPVLDVDGNQLTWKDFKTVNGGINVQCKEGGFEVDMELSGLIPNGVYSFWNVTFKTGGMNTDMEMMNIRGLGCIGSVDGSENYFTASADGKGTITAFTQTPNQLSMMGDILSCPLSDEVEFHVVGAYHMESKTWGSNLGPDGTAVEQFAFIFKNE